MLPAAMMMVTIIVLITSSLLNNIDFTGKSQNKEANRIKSQSLARTGLENITFLLRNLASQSQNMDTLCSYLPRVGGTGSCDSTVNEMSPEIADFSATPFSNWISLSQDTDFDNLTDDEADANRCGISGSYSGRDSWPSDLIRNLSTTFYIPGSDNPGVGNIARSQAVLQSLNMGVFPDNELNPGDQGFTLEAWVYFPQADLTDPNVRWPRIFDFGNPVADRSACSGCGNSNIVLALGGNTGKLTGHYFQPTGEATLNGPNDDANKARFNAWSNNSIDFPERIWAHAFMTVKKDMMRIGMTCSDDSMAKGVDNEWLSSDGPDTSDTAKTSLPTECNNGSTITKEIANPTDSEGKKIVPTGVDAGGWVSWADNPLRPNNGIPYTSNFIGRSNWQHDSFTNAFFHNVRVWKKALTEEEIQENIENDLNGIPITISSSGSSSAILINPFLKQSTRMSPRYDHNTHFLRYFTVMDNENPNNIANSAFPYTFRVMSCAWSKNNDTQSVATISSTLRYGVADDGRGIITNLKKY